MPHGDPNPLPFSTYGAQRSVPTMAATSAAPADLRERSLVGAPSGSWGRRGGREVAAKARESENRLATDGPIVETGEAPNGCIHVPSKLRCYRAVSLSAQAGEVAAHALDDRQGAQRNALRKTRSGDGDSTPHTIPSEQPRVRGR